MKNELTTALRPATFTHLQLNSGVFLTGFRYDSALHASALQKLLAQYLEKDEGILGATRGGGMFRCAPRLRSVEADGRRWGVRGGVVNDGWEVSLSTTLLEITPENFARALPGARIIRDPARGVATLTVRAALDESDYIPSLCWIGDTAEGFVLIELDNALNTAGAAFSFADQGEGTLPVEFTAHQSDCAHPDDAPFRIVFFDPV